MHADSTREDGRPQAMRPKPALYTLRSRMGSGAGSRHQPQRCESSNHADRVTARW